MILLWWLDRERHLRKSLLCCFPGWHIWYCVKWTSCSVDFAKDSFNQLFFRPNPMTADDIHMIYPHIKGTCPLWHFGEEMNTWPLDQPKSWHGSGFPTLKGLDVFNLSQAIFSFIPPHSQPFARSSFLRVCLQSILIEAQITYNTPLHIFTFFNFLASLCCLSLSTKLFSCPFFSTSMAIHFTSSSPGTPGQTFNRLKKDWVI